MCSRLIEMVTNSSPRRAADAPRRQRRSHATRRARTRSHPEFVILVGIGCARVSFPRRPHRDVRSGMADKAPPSGQNKKQGKTLMEKRADKKAKKDAKSKRGTT